MLPIGMLRSTGISMAAAMLIGMSGAAEAQTRGRDLIGDWISGARQGTSQVSDTKPTTQPGTPAAPARDPREGDPTYEQAKRLMQAIDNILKDAAKNRSDARKLPSKGDFVLTPLWTETREDRERLIRELLDAALGVVTDVPVVDVQKRIEKSRKNIRDLEKQIAEFREKQVTAPRDSLLPGVIADTVDTLEQKIKDARKRITENHKDIDKAKSEIRAALDKSGIKLSPEQVDMLLGSVLSGDLVRLVAVFNSARQIDQQLAQRMAATGENMDAARKYFAMHAALFAMLVHAQDTVIAKIDTQYLPKLNAILGDIRAAGRKTERLLRAQNRPDQRRVLEANRRSQKLAEQAAEGYRRYLIQQREQVAQARRRAAHDLSIADNTYETVEASYQLRNLMKSTQSTFEALQKLQAPTFDQIFKNEELRREFENLTKRLEVPTG